MQRRITLTLNQSELETLRVMACQEYRTTRDQAKYLLIKGLGGVNDNIPVPTNSKIASVKVEQTTTGDFAGINP